MNDSELHARLRTAAGARTFRKLGEMTATHPETVRRYMQGQAPSAEFLAAMCRALGLNGNWLLTGSGPMLADQMKADALGQADAAELLTAMANTLTGLIERVERLEVFAQTVEARVRAVGTLHAGGHADGRTGPDGRGIGRATRLGERIGGAIAERSSSAVD